MSEQIVTEPTAVVEGTELETIDAPLSIAEHAAQYDPRRDKSANPAPEPPQAPLAANATPEEKAAHHSEQQRREKETGKFRDGKTRHRAKSQQATAADAPRIQELTRKLKEAEAKLAAPRPAPVPQVAITQPHAPAEVKAPERRWLGDDQNDPEPKEADFGGDPMKYLDARQEWISRGAIRYDRHEAQRQQHTMQRATSWAHRVEAEIATNPEYAATAFQPVPWLADSPIDKFIDQDDNGAKILYHLQSNLQMRDALMQMTEFQQTKFLSLLSQRLDPASSPSAAAGATTSAPRAKVFTLPPRPPNVVRTEAHGAGNAPPPTDGSLSIAEHKKQFAPHGRR